MYNTNLQPQITQKGREVDNYQVPLKTVQRAQKPLQYRPQLTGFYRFTD